MSRYKFANYDIDSIELKCLVVSQGLKIDKKVYKKFSSTNRINTNALTCNCFKLPDDVAEVINYSIENCNVNSIQITGGSTFKSEREEKYIASYMNAINKKAGLKNINGEILLYITPPDKTHVIDNYFELGASRIACSLEVWDDRLASSITPGKREITTKERHLDALTYIAEKYGPNKAFSNFSFHMDALW